jgi:hypothetical protein
MDFAFYLVVGLLLVGLFFKLKNMKTFLLIGMLLISAACSAQQKQDSIVSQWFIPQSAAHELLHEGVFFVSIKRVVYVLIPTDKGLIKIKPVPKNRIRQLWDSNSVYIYLDENKL